MQLSDLNKLLPVTDELTVIDYETVGGTDVSTGTLTPVGIGVADASGNFYFDLRKTHPSVVREIHRRLELRSLVAHNVNFDGAVLAKELGNYKEFTYCTLGLYMQLATEGWTGQRWGLKAAQKDVLLWPETNEAELDHWLAEAGLGKADMGQAPYDILGKYCALDAEATWQLLQVLLPVLAKFPQLKEHHKEFLITVKLLYRSLISGISINETGLKEYSSLLEKTLVSHKSTFYNHSLLQTFVKNSKERKLKEIQDKEPAMVTKKGEVSKRWTAWSYKYLNIKNSLELDPFNINSKIKLGELFYGTGMYHTETIKPHPTDTKIAADKKAGRRTRPGTVRIVGHGTDIVVPYTGAGKVPVDKKVLPHLGELGKLLAGYNKKTKELSYVNSCIGKLNGGVLHSQYRAPGTVTGRLSGTGGFNLQQQPKTRGYLENFKARPGHKIVQLDFSAVEPVVLAEFSQDPALVSIYGAGRPPNDIYLFTASKIPALGKNIMKYYDPDNPTASGIAAAKKNCKADRQIAKIVQLSKSYGAGAAKIFETLTLMGVTITFEEVVAICTDFDKIYVGTRVFEDALIREWEQRGGWIFNGRGRPLAIHPDYTKDILNRFCQSTGHDLLYMFNSNFDKLQTEHNFTSVPWIPDYHDEKMEETPDDSVEIVSWAMEESLAMVNKTINALIPIKGDVQVANNLADIKVED